MPAATTIIAGTALAASGAQTISGAVQKKEE